MFYIQLLEISAWLWVTAIPSSEKQLVREVFLKYETSKRQPREAGNMLRDHFFKQRDIDTVNFLLNPTENTTKSIPK